MKFDAAKQLITDYFKLFTKALSEFSRNDPLRMGGATAFFTTFALPPILIILIQVIGLIYSTDKVRRQLFNNLEGIIGSESAQQILVVLTGFRELARNWYITVGGFIFLLFVATTLFKVIKSSLNQLWKVKVIRKRGIWRSLQTRLQSILVILIAGVLFVIGVLAEAAQAFLGHYIFEISPIVATYFNTALSNVLSVVITTLWFAVVFRYLPDARPEWKVALKGAFITSILFTIGKVVLRWLLALSNVNTLYGASGSIVLLLLFVFYSSLILYYGATFTKVWGEFNDNPIKALPHAMHYQISEVRREVKT
jgi:membrane protein